MPKTIILDDETYNKLKNKAIAEDRSMSKMAKILISQALKPVQQINSINDSLGIIIPTKGTVFDATTGFATVDEAIEFYEKSSKPIHLAGSDSVLSLSDLIEYSDEMISLRKEYARLDSEIDEDGSDWQKLAVEQQEVKAKIIALVEKADNFMGNYQGLTSQGGPVVQ